jgi:hypothetical protein
MPGGFQRLELGTTLFVWNTNVYEQRTDIGGIIVFYLNLNLFLVLNRLCSHLFSDR